jgi:drug/metabolite transporter (DMT)-like permease/Fe-S-cluster containining protein
MSLIQFSNIKTRLKAPQIGYILVILSACFTGAIHSLTKPLLSIVGPSGIELNPFVFAAIIYLINGIFFSPIKKDGVPMRRMQRRDLLIIAIIGIAEVSGLVTYFFGLKQTTAVNASILCNSEILFAVFIALIIFKERLQKKEFLPFAAIIGGIIILPVSYDLIQSKLTLINVLYGNLLILLACAICAIDITLCRYVTSIDPKRITQLTSFIGAGATLFMMVILHIPFNLDPRQLPSIVVLGFFGTGMATFLFLTALKRIGTTRTVLLYSTNFAFGVVLAMIFLHESITLVNLASIALASIGIYLLRNRLVSPQSIITPKKEIEVAFTGLCGSCTHQSCCTSIRSPLLFNTDIQKLKTIGNDGEEYTEEIMVEGKKIRTIRKKPNSSLCTFWDEKKKKCGIYNNRPFDCIMYPFDIFSIHGKYHWGVYSYNPQSNWQWTEEHLKMLENNPQFNEIMDNIEVFANRDENNNLKKLDEFPHTILREVNFNKLINQS